MCKIRVSIENELGESISSKSYDLGNDFGNIDKLERAITSLSVSLLPAITSTVLSLEEASFLKKATTKPTAATK